MLRMVGMMLPPMMTMLMALMMIMVLCIHPSLLSFPFGGSGCCHIFQAVFDIVLGMEFTSNLHINGLSGEDYGGQ